MTTLPSATRRPASSAPPPSRSSPAPSDPWAVRATEVLAPVYPSPQGRTFEDGSGCRLVDDLGRVHLDMTSGIAVLALGHRSPVVADALRDAADHLLHVSNLLCTRPAVELADELVRRSFADRVFFANSGTEAVEAAIKIARRCAGPRRRRIVCFDRGFHGRTLAALAATDREQDRAAFGPLPGAFLRAPFDDDAALALVNEHAAAVIVEPVQGEGGIRPARSEWLRSLRERCDDTGTLLIVDEIQCGLGRTGRLWAHEYAGIEPDLMTVAKPLGGGLPIGAVMMTEAVSGALVPGDHGSTFGGNPAACSVALAVLRAIDRPELLTSVRERGARLQRRLAEIPHPWLREVRGLGLMIGVVLDRSVGPVVAAARDEGLLVVGAGGDVIRFLPPLVADDDDLDEAVTRFARALDRAAECAA